MSAPRRPLSLTLTALGLFLVACWNLWRVWIIARQSQLLEQIGTTLDPQLRLVLALFWALILLLLAGSLWQRRPATRIFLPLVVLLYGSYQLLLLFFMPTPAARQGWPLQLLALGIATGWSAWVSFRPAHRDIWSGGDR